MATLDRKLQEIAEESARGAPAAKKQPEPSEQEGVPTTLDTQVCAVMGEQLVSYFNGKLQGQGQGVSVKRAFVPLIQEVGLYLFTMKPASQSSYGYFIDTSFTAQLPKETLARIVTAACGEYARSTDLEDAVIGGGMERLTALLPEMACMKAELLDIPTHQLSYMATINPYLIVMGMVPEHRALATLAVAKAIENGHITLPIIAEHMRFSGSRQNALNASLPLASDFVEVAAEHGITEVVPAMEEYRRVWQTHFSV